MITTTQNSGQISNIWNYPGITLMSGGTYSAIAHDSRYYNDTVNFSPFENLRTTFIFFTPFIKKETEISNQTTSLLFQIPEHDKKRIINKLRNKYYYLLDISLTSYNHILFVLLNLHFLTFVIIIQ